MTLNISVVIKNSLQNVTGSLKNNIPTITVPIAPIPVHTGYAVPIGIVRVAIESSHMLSDNATTKPIHQNASSTPVVIFVFPKQNAKQTSMKPAIIKIIQFIINEFCLNILLNTYLISH